MTKMFPIDKGVALPSKPGGNGRARQYPWLEMEVGDSFFAPDKKTFGQLGKVNKQYAPRHFVQRKVDGGMRVWRDR